MADVYNVSFVIDALTSGAFSKTFSNAGKTTSALQKKMSALSQNQAAIASFGKLQAAANAKGDALNAARARPGTMTD